MKIYRNKITTFSFICVIAVIIGGCSDDFLTKYPLHKLTEETAFVTYDNFKTFSWGFYRRFDGFPTGDDSNDSSYYPSHSTNETNTDNFNYSYQNNRNGYKYQTKTEPSTSSTYSDAYSYIRRANIMLRNIDSSEMSEGERNHWRSVGLFFRSMEYFTLISNYGDVIWLDQVIGDSDKDIYLGPRVSRDIVAKNVLDDLQWAEQHINENGDGNNTVNVHVVRAMISRFGLFEGTWRKYHSLPDPNTYLEASAAASEKLIASFPDVMASYDDLFNSEDLTVGKSTGVLLARKYSNLISGGAHSIGRVVRTSAWVYEMTKDAVNSYLCTDGKPVSQSAVYEGDDDMYKEFRNRDRRLYYTVVPPYRIKITGNPGTSKNDDQWELTDDPKESEYIDLMKTITTANGKYLPTRNFAGYVTHGSPHFKDYPNGQGFIVGYFGYYTWKYYNRHEDDMALRASTQNYPIFRMGEIMVNHAEAMFELGRFDQSVANKTINVLRKRANIPDMKVNDITATFDTDREADVNPVLWEIRRERRVELMGDGFRFRDIKRWKKGEYINKPAVYYGVKVKNSDYGNKLKFWGGNTDEGYVVQYQEEIKGWLDKYYLEPLPIKEQVLNPNLEQNPGWKDYRGSETE